MKKSGMLVGVILNVIIRNAQIYNAVSVYRVSLCIMSLCRVSFCWMPWFPRVDAKHDAQQNVALLNDCKHNNSQWNGTQHFIYLCTQYWHLAEWRITKINATFSSDATQSAHVVLMMNVASPHAWHPLKFTDLGGLSVSLSTNTGNSNWKGRLVSTADLLAPTYLIMLVDLHFITF